MAGVGDPLGCDIHCTTGFPLVMRLAWGEENLGNAAIRRLNSDEGCLESIGDDPTYGYNITALLNKSFDGPGDKAAVGSRVQAELAKDDRVQAVRARVLSSDDQLIVQVGGETAEGPFGLVLGVGDLTVDRLNQGITAPATTTGTP